MEEDNKSGHSTNKLKDSKKKKPLSRGSQCCVHGCMNYAFIQDGTPSGIHFFKPPKDVMSCKQKRDRWCRLIKRQDGRDGFTLTKYTNVCHEHFKPEDINISLVAKRWTLNKGAEPVVFNPNANEQKITSPRKRLAFSSDISVQHLSTEIDEFEIIESGVASQTEIHTSEASTQTEHLFPEHIDFKDDHSYSNNNVERMLESKDVESLRHAITQLSDHIYSLKGKMDMASDYICELSEVVYSYESNRFSLNNIKDDDSAMLFYTGFPNYKSFDSVFQYLEPKAQNMVYWRGQGDTRDYKMYRMTEGKPGPKRKLTLQDELFMVLVRLKVGLFVRDISARFEISAGQFSKIFTTWINFLYCELPQLFPFPSQERIRHGMPKSFHGYPTTRIILDCTEVFVEIPSAMITQSETWSNYKHHNTYKVLVGVTPNGTVSFISTLWGGRVSDKEIVKDSGVLNLLDSGDNVMADRGFEISDILPDGVTLNIPPFKHHKQLTAHEVEDTMNIASVRIHVERAIGRITNYHILDGVIPLSLSHIADQMFTVISYLTCFLPPLVPE